MEQILGQLGGLLLGAVPTVILLLVLVGLYKVLLHNKLEQVLHQRRERTEGAIQKARADVAAAEAKTGEYEGRIREAKLAIYKAQEARRKQWLDARAATLAEARARAEATVKEARAALERDVESARTALHGDSEKLAAEIARTVLAPAAAHTPPAGGGR